MSDTTTHLGLPYLLAAQAQKHVTHNEALRLLDAIVQLSVLDRTRTAPPANPADGDRHIVASGATGLWTGWDLNIAFWVDGAWIRLVPRVGWQVWVADEAVPLVWTGSVWQDVADRPLQVPWIGGTAVTQGPNDTTADRLVRVQDGYVKGTILGAVALSGGVPTGAVIERGTNANGDYVRFADGTQICTSPPFSFDVTTSVGSMFRSAAQTWTFPAAFSTTSNLLVVPGSSNNVTTHFLSARVVSTTQGEIGAFAPTSITGRSGRLAAIGRWA